MKKRLITVPVNGVGPMNCENCDFIRDENDDDESDENDRQWCGAFEEWIPNNESNSPERLSICIESEVE